MKKAVKDRDTGEEKYRAIFDHSAVPLWEEDISRLRAHLDGMKRAGIDLRAHLAAHPDFIQEAVRLIDVIGVNQPSLRLFEADSMEQLLGPLDIVLDSVSRTAFAETILAIVEGRNDVEVESSARTLKGRRLVLIVKSYIPQGGAAYPHMLISQIDITARKDAEERESQSARILRSIIDSFPDMIFVKDNALRIVLCNTALAASVGKEPEAMHGKTDIENGWSADLVKGNPEKGIVGSQKSDRRALAGETVRTPAEPSEINGEIRYFDTVKFPLRDPDGTITGFLGIGRDITEHRNSEQQVRAGETRYRRLMEQAADGIMVIDGEGRFLMVNSALCSMLGYDRQTLLGMNILETYPDDLRDQGKQRLDEIQAAQALRFERPIRKKDGSLLQIEVSAQRLEDGAMQAILHDITERKRAEAALAWERSLFNTLMHHLPDYIYFKDRQSRFIRTSTAHARVLRLRDPSEAVGKSDADFYRADHARKALEDEQKIISTGISLENIEERETYPDRPDTWAITTKMPFRDASGKIVGTFGITHDITERKRLELALAWERGLFDMLMDNVPDRIYFKDKDSRFIRASRSHANERGLGNPSEELGKTDADFSDPAHARKASEEEHRVMQTGAPILDIEEKVMLPGRPDTWFISTKMPLRNPEGNIVGTFGISHDITSRKILETRNQQLATLVESADDAIVGLDLDRRITIWNKGAERLYGYTAEEMIGAPTSILIPPEREEEARRIRERILHGEQITHFETTRLRKDGVKIQISLTLSAIHDTGGTIAGMASIARDITEQKALQAQLDRVRRLEGLATLAAGVAHQFNNINTVVGGYLQMLRLEMRLPDQAGAYVEAAQEAVRRASDITDRLLALTGSASGITDALRLDELARAVIAAHEGRVAVEKVRLVVALSETPPVRGDTSRVKFVLSSLVGNALDSLLDRPVRMVSVSTGSTKDAAWCEIEDTGAGIPEADLPRLFSPFFSAKGEWAPPGSPQAKLKGVGLSLAISSMTISEYGGRIDVRSSTGAGSTFRVVMPFSTRGA